MQRGIWFGATHAGGFRVLRFEIGKGLIAVATAQ